MNVARHPGPMDPAPGPEHSLGLETDHGRVPLGYVQVGGQVYLVARHRSAMWPVDILRPGKATLQLPGGARRRGSAQLVIDPADQARILELFRSKYGDEGFTRWYAHPARIIQVDLSADNAAGDATSYGRWIESEFDSIADDYDRHILGNRVNRLLRDRSLAHLRVVFRDRHRLLEVGCGSGMETLQLLRDGHEITAVDISERMLEVVRRKATAEGLVERLRCVHLRARDLDQLPQGGDVGTFDGAYSTYGAMNCEPDLRPTVRALASILRPGTPFVAGVYNRWCLFEFAGYLLALQPERAVGRAHNPVRVGASRFCVDVFAYSAPEFRRLFAPEFTVAEVEGVPVTIPPSDLTGYVERLSSHFSTWARWDASIGRRWPAKYLGDHFLMTFVRSPVG